MRRLGAGSGAEAGPRGLRCVVLKVLRGDKRAILTAAAKTQAAADWMHAQQPAAAESAGEAAQARPA